MRRQLWDAEFYKDQPTDLWPAPDVLSSANTAQTVIRFRERLREFSAPISSEPDGQGLSEQAVMDYLRQFRSRDAIKEALALVDGVRLFGRDDLVSALSHFLSQRPAFRDAVMCPLGSAKDSSAIVTYYAEDIAPTAGLTSTQPAQLIPPIAKIIFADDFIGSGHQVIDILQSWFGLERTEELGEERLPLPAVCVEVIRSSELAFVFCAGLSDGPEELQLWLTSPEVDGRDSRGARRGYSAKPREPSLNRSGHGGLRALMS